MKCPHCGKSIAQPRKPKKVDPTRVAQDLLKGFYAGLKGEALRKYAQRSMPKEKR